MRKYFVDNNGEYLGVFLYGAVPPQGAIEVNERPDLNHIWDGDWVYSESRHWENIRQMRDHLLKRTDLPASLTDHPQRQAILDYRQALRDIPQTSATPDAVVWPDNPLKNNNQ